MGGLRVKGDSTSQGPLSRQFVVSGPESIYQVQKAWKFQAEPFEFAPDRRMLGVAPRSIGARRGHSLHRGGGRLGPRVLGLLRTASLPLDADGGDPARSRPQPPVSPDRARARPPHFAEAVRHREGLRRGPAEILGPRAAV